MDSTQVETLITQNSEIVDYMRMPRGRCFDCAVKVASILRACNVQHRIVGMLKWDSFTRETDTHFVVAVYGLEDAFKRDNPGLQATAGVLPALTKLFNDSSGAKAVVSNFPWFGVSGIIRILLLR